MAGAVLALGLAAPAVTAPAVVRAGSPVMDFTYPGAAPCNGTLQACVNGVPSGATIRIATDDRVDLDASAGLKIRKSLTLRPAPGFDPVIGSADPLTPRQIVIEDAAGTAVDVTLRDLRFDAAGIDVSFFSHPGNRFTAIGNTVSHRNEGNNDRAIAVDVRVDDTIVVIERNTLTTTGAPLRFLSMLPAPDDTATARLVGNRISAPVRDDAYHGIDLDIRAFGTVTLDVHGNTIRKAMGCNCGGSGALSLYVEGTPTATVNLVGNTIDRTQGFSSGIGMILDVVASGGMTTVNIHNNVISNGSGSPFWFPSLTPRLKVRFGHNAVHQNGEPSRWGGYRPASLPSTLAPGYVNAKTGDYRLTAGSQLRDRGEVCTSGGAVRTDAAGRFRVAGANVDIGAYEYGAPPRGTGVVRLGTSGPDTLDGTDGRDILCGFGGADVLSGGAMPDVHAGGPGDDRLRARDGAGGDLVMGGNGRDTCRSDPGDRVTGCP